ncbi:hypothetical protein CsSME_00024277 [Camellia sinensis var. sinensis]
MGVLWDNRHFSFEYQNPYGIGTLRIWNKYPRTW